MSWPFGGRRRTYVGTAVSRVIEDALLPDIIKTAPITAILRNQSIPDTILDELIQGVGMKADRAMNFAESGEYWLGTPNHTFMTDSIGLDEVQTVLEGIHGSQVDITYHHFAALHNLHVGFKQLNEDYGYDELTNELTSLSTITGFPVYMENLVGIVNTQIVGSIDPTEIIGDEFVTPNPESMTVYETAPNTRILPWVNPQAGDPNWLFSDTDPDSVVLYYAYMDGGGTIQRDSVNLGLDGTNVESAYFQVKYEYDIGLVGIDQKTGYFTYEFNSGVYPIVDSTVGRSNNVAEFLPFVIFRQDKVNLAAESNHTEDSYTSSVRMMKKLGMDYQQISDDIHTNDEIAKLQDAVMAFAIPIDTTNKGGIKYLYEFFRWLSLTDTTQVMLSEAAFDAEGNQIINKSISIEDGGFKMQLNYGSMESSIVTGYGNPLGTPTEIGDTTVWVETETVTYTVYITQIIDDQPTPVPALRTKDVYTYNFYKQIDDFSYRRIRVAGLSMVYKVAGRDVFIDTGEDAGRLLIPLSHNICKEHFSALERDKLYSVSMHFIFNSLETKKIPWYATSFFTGILFLIGVVLTIYSLGTAGPAIASTYATFVATYGVYGAAVLVALKYIAINYATQYALKFVTEEVGAELTLLIATIALVVGVSGTQLDATWGAKLTEYSTGLVNAATAQYERDTEQYLLESQQFEIESEEKLDELAELQKQFETTSVIDPLEFVGQVPRIVLGESPDQYYTRTTGGGNVGVLAYDYISSYVDISLQLPTFHDTMRGFNNNDGRSS